MPILAGPIKRKSILQPVIVPNQQEQVRQEHERGDAGSFKAWLRQISQSTAEAAKEGGGLLGFGGVQVSDAEKATLTEISSALGV